MVDLNFSASALRANDLERSLPRGPYTEPARACLDRVSSRYGPRSTLLSIQFPSRITLRPSIIAGVTAGCRGGQSIHALIDPGLDVTASKAEVPADPETRRALPAIAPGVEGCEGDLEVVGGLPVR